MSSKRQMTMAKMMREQAVRERRARKLEKRQARKLAAAGPPPDGDVVDAGGEGEGPPLPEGGGPQQTST